MLHDVSVILTTPDQRSGKGVARIQEWDKKARTSRALRILGILWGLMLISVIIPIAHFVLVPGFFIAGPIVAFIVYDQQRAIVGGEGACPKCGRPFTIARSSSVHWPLSDLCTECQTSISITPEELDPAAAQD